MPSGASRLGIGAVLERLRADFPDVTISKIRYLEAEGLVTPERAPSGYRRYSAADVERLAFVLTAQRDRYWPLKVIREHLDAYDRGLRPSLDGAAQVVEEASTDEIPSVEALGQRRPMRLTAAELARHTEVDDPTVQSLVSFGLVRPVDGYFDEIDLEIARAAGALMGAGIEVRHLRPFRTAAEREVGLVEHVLGRKGVGAKARGGTAVDSGQAGLDDATVAAEVARRCLALHVALVRRALPPQP